jgi:hypothetical protein
VALLAWRVRRCCLQQAVPCCWLLLVLLLAHHRPAPAGCPPAGRHPPCRQPWHHLTASGLWGRQGSTGQGSTGWRG